MQPLPEWAAAGPSCCCSAAATSAPHPAALHLRSKPAHQSLIRSAQPGWAGVLWQETCAQEAVAGRTAPVCVAGNIAAPCQIDLWQCRISQASPRHRSATSAVMFVATERWEAAPPSGGEGSRAAAMCCSRLSRSSAVARHCRMLRSSACPTLCPLPAHSCAIHLRRAEYSCQVCSIYIIISTMPSTMQRGQESLQAFQPSNPPQAVCKEDRNASKHSSLRAGGSSAFGWQAGGRALAGEAEAHLDCMSAAAGEPDCAAAMLSTALRASAEALLSSSARSWSCER